MCYLKTIYPTIIRKKFIINILFSRGMGLIMKINLAVLFGGVSVEHEISIITALQAIRSLNKNKYNVIPIYITKKNEFFTGDMLFDIENFRDISSLLSKSKQVYFIKKHTVGSGQSGLFIEGIKKGLLEKAFTQHIDVAFPIVHGTNVEDGTLQGFLEMLSLPYVGCDVTSSAAGMDKGISKAVLKMNSIPVLDGVFFSSDEYFTDSAIIINKIEAACRYPVIVKPVNLGSSVGVGYAASRESLIDAIENAVGYTDRIMIENAVQNLLEINCSVYGDSESAQASVCEEPVSAGDLLTFDAKYMGGGAKEGMSGSGRKLPADIPADMSEKIQKYAVDSFKALGCAGVTRVDFLVDRLSGDIFVNELNTIPGSLSFYLWEASGLKYTDLLDGLVSLAFKRHRDRERINFSYDTGILENFKFGGSKKLK